MDLNQYLSITTYSRCKNCNKVFESIIEGLTHIKDIHNLKFDPRDIVNLVKNLGLKPEASHKVM